MIPARRTPNPRIKTNAANRSNFTFGDERDWAFDTVNELQFRVPTKIPPRHESILPPPEKGENKISKKVLGEVSVLANQREWIVKQCREQISESQKLLLTDFSHIFAQCYKKALDNIGIAGVKRIEITVRGKIDQRTTGGPMALRKAFKYFDSDGSGDIDPDEFYAAMRSFGLEFTEDQVLALFGYYDVDCDGALSYYEFVDKVLESGFGLDADAPEKPPQLVQLAAVIKDKKQIRMKTVLRKEDLDIEEARRMFDKFDANKSGEIDLRELSDLTAALGLQLTTGSFTKHTRAFPALRALLTPTSC